MMNLTSQQISRVEKEIEYKRELNFEFEQVGLLWAKGYS